MDPTSRNKDERVLNWLYGWLTMCNVAENQTERVTSLGHTADKGCGGTVLFRNPLLVRNLSLTAEMPSSSGSKRLRCSIVLMIWLKAPGIWIKLGGKQGACLQGQTDMITSLKRYLTKPVTEMYLWYQTFGG